MKMQDKVAIITGASRGIGREIALKLASEGCSIVIASKTAEPHPKLPGTIFTVAEEVEKAGGKALPIQTNVREEHEVKAMVDKTLEKFGRIDYMINNAGALWWYPVLQTPAKRFDLVMDVNIRGTFLCSQAVLPTMIEQKFGHIVNMSPPISFKVLEGKVAYMISKFGMTMITYGLAEEMRENNIAVNSLWPVTIIESQASINFGLGDRSMWRKADIMADATYHLLLTDPAECTGQALLDEQVLKKAGITDFAPYACVPGSTPMAITWDSVSAGDPDEKATFDGKGGSPTHSPDNENNG